MAARFSQFLLDIVNPIFYLDVIHLLITLALYQMLAASQPSRTVAMVFWLAEWIERCSRLHADPSHYLTQPP